MSLREAVPGLHCARCGRQCLIECTTGIHMFLLLQSILRVQSQNLQVDDCSGTFSWTFSWIGLLAGPLAGLDLWLDLRQVDQTFN